MYERKVKENITIEVKAKVQELQNQQEFLEALIKELEEKHRIELRKKAILKNQCDAAYLRGVSAISTEALKMSHSTLDDFYKGMKMPAYDGKNMLQQMKQLQGASTLTGQIQHEVTVTKESRNYTSNELVPPLATGEMRPNSTHSFERHVQVSKTAAGSSKMFNATNE